MRWGGLNLSGSEDEGKGVEWTGLERVGLEDEGD